MSSASHCSLALPRAARLRRGVPGSLVGDVVIDRPKDLREDHHTAVPNRAASVACAPRTHLHPIAPIVNETFRYALIILFSSAVGLMAVLANRLTERVKVPVALIVLV